MRLLQSVLTRLDQTKKPQYKFVTHLLGLMLMLPGHATFRNMSRYSPSSNSRCPYKILYDPIISAVRQPVGVLHPAFETLF